MLLYANNPANVLCLLYACITNSILGVTCEHGSSAHSCWISLFRRRLLPGRWGHWRLGYAPRRLPVADRSGLLLSLCFRCVIYLCVYLAFGPSCIKLWIILLLMKCVICLWYHFWTVYTGNPGLVYEHRGFGILRSRVRQKWYQSHIDCRS